MDMVEQFYHDAAVDAWFWDEMSVDFAEALLTREASLPFVTWWLHWYGPPDWYQATAAKPHMYWAMCAAAWAGWHAALGVTREC